VRYRYAISYESDMEPVETVRGEFVSTGTPRALYQAGKLARDSWPKGRRFRSVVTLIELLDAVTDDAIAVTEAADV